MPNAFVFSTSSSTAKKHFADTVRDGFSISSIESLLSADVRSTLHRAYPDGVAYMWGGKSGGQDERYWELMSPGDLLLGYEDSSLYFCAYFVAKNRSAAAGAAAWPDATDPPYNLQYFFTQPQFFTPRPVSELSDYFGKVYQGLRRVRRSGELLRDWGTFEAFVDAELLRSGTASNDSAGNDLAAEEMRRRQERTFFLRNQALAKRAKQRDGYTCTICGMNFESVYGDLGRGYAEAHHLNPLSERPETEWSDRLRTSIDEIVTVCANCHRMLHRKQPAVDGQELGASLRSSKRGRDLLRVFADEAI